MNTATFSPLLERIRQGDNRALAEVLQDSGQYCVRVLMTKTNCSPEEADDIVVDAVLNFRDKVLKGQVQELTSLNAYLYRTCWNMYQELRRKKERIRNHADEIRYAFYQESQDTLDPLEWEEMKKQEEDHYERKLKATQTALKRLDEKCREILTLFYLQRQRMKEIASKMGFASANVAKTSKSRCYKKWINEIQVQMQS